MAFSLPVAIQEDDTIEKVLESHTAGEDIAVVAALGKMAS